MPHHILLVEDNPDDADLLERRLRQGIDGHLTIARSETAADAIAYIAAHRPDVVILDMHLPDLTEVLALQQIEEWSREMPVIVVTGSADEHMVRDAIRAGAEAYLPKEWVTTDRFADDVIQAFERHRHWTKLLQDLRPGSSTRDHERP